MKLKDRVAIVTGAGREGKGIGRAIAQALATEGARVAVASRTEANAAAVAREICEAGGQAIAIACDVTDASAIEAMVARVLGEWGRLDVLVNNAGITRDNLVLRMKEDDWDAVLDTNLKGAFLCSRAVLKPMLRQKGGRIINISSIRGVTGAPGQANYAAAKAGIFGLTKSLAQEVASRGILVNSVAPGFIETAMTDGLADEVKKSFFENIPLQRYGSPEEIARVVVFLAGDDATYITGQVINVDGGLNMLPFL